MGKDSQKNSYFNLVNRICDPAITCCLFFTGHNQTIILILFYHVFQKLFRRYFGTIGLFSFSIRYPAAQKQFKALLITETAGWHHESIPNGITAIENLADRHNFDLKLQQEAIPITDEGLKDIDVVIFLSTTADIFDENEQQAFERFIRSGKGYVGIHAAADTEYDWAWYTQLVGRMFHIHPAQQTAVLTIENHISPGWSIFPDRLLWTDEWYEFGEEKTPGLKYLVAVDENTYDPVVTWKGRDPDSNGNTMTVWGRGWAISTPSHGTTNSMAAALFIRLWAT